MAQTTPNHTQTVSGWAAHDSSGKITPYTFKRRYCSTTNSYFELMAMLFYKLELKLSTFHFIYCRENGVTDVTIKILYCGICHTDLHHAKDDWGITMYPVVPG
jgi:cinnamyl-alcohol dehydrogenase